MCAKDGVETLLESALPRVRSSLSSQKIIAGRYRLEKCLGEGSFGVVYSATQLSIQRTVALKALHTHLWNDARAFQRFYREARAAGTLNHPNVVRVFDFGIDGDCGVPFLVMEYVRGVSLEQVLQERARWSEPEAAMLLTQVAHALTAAHAQGIVHRDLKPENIMVRGELAGQPGATSIKVLDFGLAKLFEVKEERGLTSLGELLGTPLYMSPEQARGHAADHRADLYSLGCMLHELITGEPPFFSEESMHLVHMHISDPAPPLPQTGVDGRALSSGLRALHRGLLAKYPDERPQSAQLVAEHLAHLAAPPEEEAPTWTSIPQAPASEHPSYADTQAPTSKQPSPSENPTAPPSSAAPPTPPRRSMRKALGFVAAALALLLGAMMLRSPSGGPCESTTPLPCMLITDGPQSARFSPSTGQTCWSASLPIPGKRSLGWTDGKLLRCASETDPQGGLLVLSRDGKLEERLQRPCLALTTLGRQVLVLSAPQRLLRFDGLDALREGRASALQLLDFKADRIAAHSNHLYSAQGQTLFVHSLDTGARLRSLQLEGAQEALERIAMTPSGALAMIIQAPQPQLLRFDLKTGHPMLPLPLTVPETLKVAGFVCKSELKGAL